VAARARARDGRGRRRFLRQAFPGRGARRARQGAGSMIAILLVLLFAGAAVPQPFAPDWATLAGAQLFGTKGCGTCHTVRGAVGGQGGTQAPPLDALKRANSPVIVAAALWNHAPDMNEAFRQLRVARPTLEGQELLDIVAYVVAAARDTGADTQQVIPGTPDR